MVSNRTWVRSWVFLISAACLFSTSSRGEQASLSATNNETVVTNIAQLRALVAKEWRLRCGMELTGVVCAVSAPKGIVVLADDSGAERFALDFCGQELRVGQLVWLSAPRCEVTRQRMGLNLRRRPLVDNDGEHGDQVRTGKVFLAAGKYPVRLEWFNTFFPGIMSLSVEGEGLRRQKIPNTWLSRRSPDSGAGAEGFVPGLDTRVFSGSWRYLPDFSELVAMRSGVATNFDLGNLTRSNNVGVEFTGFFEAPIAGDYTFHVRSDDGSMLYLGEALPRVRVIGEAKLPELQRSFIGQVTGPTGSYRWTQVEGNVHQIVSRPTTLEIELQSRSGSRIQIDIADATELPLELLANSQVRVAGVNRDVVIPGGQRVVGLLSTVSRREVQLVEVSLETWAAHPLTTISNLVRQADFTNKTVVRLAGKLRGSKSPEHFDFVDTTGVLRVERTDSGAAFAGISVEVIGVLKHTGTNLLMQTPGYRRVPEAGEKAAPLPQLTSAAQVLRLDGAEAARGYPVLMRGVVTCTWPESYRNAVLQDNTRGVFVRLNEPGKMGMLKIGEFWEVEGVTARGYFSPIIDVRRMTRVSEGRMPLPVQPTWDQLLNGSLDASYVEIECVIVSVQGNSATLLTHWGKITVEFFTEKPAQLESSENKLVRLRGCLLAAWDEKTRQVKVGQLRLGSATISMDQSLPADPFEARAKSVGELLQFDLQASSFQRVKIAGQFLKDRGEEYFMMSGTNGVRFVPNEPVTLNPGDLVEVAGIPELGGASPVLREAFVRRAASAELPPAKKLSSEQMNPAAHDATRVQVEGLLLSSRNSRGERFLEMQNGAWLFTARLREKSEQLPVIEPGSRLALTGVCADQSKEKAAGQTVDNFELLLGSPGDVIVLLRPPWWTLRRLLVALGILVVILAGAALWVVQLRRRVESQTEIIRTNVQKAATLEERTRIARELHDTLEQSLAGISFQLGALAGALRGVSADAMQLLERARLMVKHGQEEARRSVHNLRTFALERGDLPAAISTMSKHSVNGMPVRIETVVNGEPVALAYQVENHLLRIGQEALTNALKHGKARNVKFELNYDSDAVGLTITDDGCGFNVAQTAPTEAGHFGLLGMRERVNKIGGTIQIASETGAGTSIAVKVPRNQKNSDTELL